MGIRCRRSCCRCRAGGRRNRGPRWGRFAIDRSPAAALRRGATVERAAERVEHAAQQRIAGGDGEDLVGEPCLAAGHERRGGIEQDRAEALRGEVKDQRCCRPSPDDAVHARRGRPSIRTTPSPTELTRPRSMTRRRGGSPEGDGHGGDLGLSTHGGLLSGKTPARRRGWRPAATARCRSAARPEALVERHLERQLAAEHLAERLLEAGLVGGDQRPREAELKRRLRRSGSFVQGGELFGRQGLEVGDEHVDQAAVEIRPRETVEQCGYETQGCRAPRRRPCDRPRRPVCRPARRGAHVRWRARHRAWPCGARSAATSSLSRDISAAWVLSCSASLRS